MKTKTNYADLLCTHVRHTGIIILNSWCQYFLNIDPTFVVQGFCFYLAHRTKHTWPPLRHPSSTVSSTFHMNCIPQQTPQSGIITAAPTNWLSHIFWGSSLSTTSITLDKHHHVEPLEVIIHAWYSKRTTCCLSLYGSEYRTRSILTQLNKRNKETLEDCHGNPAWILPPFAVTDISKGRNLLHPEISETF